jgi:hypothetical protein
MMNPKMLTISVIVSAAILMSGIIQNNAIAYPQQKQGYSYHSKMTMQPGFYAFGTIASLQNDDPAMINNHFGNTPIFGTIEKLLKVEK